jgi:hypothetical protein
MVFHKMSQYVYKMKINKHDIKEVMVIPYRVIMRSLDELIKMIAMSLCFSKISMFVKQSGTNKHNSKEPMLHHMKSLSAV